LVATELVATDLVATELVATELVLGKEQAMAELSANRQERWCRRRGGEERGGEAAEP
jgi:hypothetical protein